MVTLKRRINNYWIYRTDKKIKVTPQTKPPSPLLDAFDKMEFGEYMSVTLKVSRLIRAMLVRRDYNIEQIKKPDGFIKVTKVRR